MAEYNLNFVTTNIALTEIQQITKIQVGYDTDGNFTDVFEEGGEYIDLTLTRSAEATYSANNTTLTRINIIKIIGRKYVTSEETVLAYRPLNYTLDIIPGEDAVINVHVTLFATIEGTQEGSIELNYLLHSEKDNPEEVHSNIYNLPFQEGINDPSDKFPLIVSNLGSEPFNPASLELQRKDNTPVYFVGRGHTYSNLLWYYWEPEKINHFLNLLAAKFNEDGQHEELSEYTLSLQSKISKPFLGFNARYGSYLYWYDISDDYICVIYVGSNHYNAVDIFIVPNSEHIDSKKCVFFDNETRQFRIKFNRWYNHLYFIADNKAYQINTDLENGHLVYQQEVRNSFSYQDSSNDELLYFIRAFQTEQEDAIQLLPLFKDNNASTKYYQLEFSDIGDVLVNSFQDSEGKTYIGIRNIFDSNSLYDSYNFDTPINALNLYDSELCLFNKFTTDNTQTAYRLMGLYQTSLTHLQYFLKNDYVPVYLGEEYSIGWSNIYNNYLTLFKAPLVLDRRRCLPDWLDNTIYIEQGKIKHYYGLLEDIYTGALSYSSDNNLFCERGVCVKKDILGAYRNITSIMKMFPYAEWILYSGSYSIRSAYDYDNYQNFYPLKDYSCYSIVFKDAEGNLETFKATGLNNFIYQFETPIEGVFTQMNFLVNTNYQDVYFRFYINNSFQDNFPASSEFASKYWNSDLTLKEGCEISIKQRLAIEAALTTWQYKEPYIIYSLLDSTYEQYLNQFPSSAAYTLIFKNETEQMLLFADSRKNYTATTYAYFFQGILDEEQIEIILVPPSDDILSFSIQIAINQEPEQSAFITKFFNVDTEQQTCSLKEGSSASLEIQIPT